MLIPNTFTIGDDWIIRAKNVTSGRTKQLIPDAVVTATIVDKLTREQIIAPLNLPLVVIDEATYEGIVYKDSFLVTPINNTTYALNITVAHGGTTNTVTRELTALKDNTHSPRVNVVVPAQFTIGDDLPFRALGVTDEVGTVFTGEVLYELLERITRTTIATGAMSNYDPAKGHYEAVIPKALIGGGTVAPNNDYVLHVIIKSYLDTTVSAFLAATFDSMQSS